jgi:hypothetical protein
MSGLLFQLKWGWGFPQVKRKKGQLSRTLGGKKKSQVNLENTERVMHALKASTQ